MSRPRRIPVTPLGEVVSLLRCVRCAGRLRVESAGSDGERLVCTDCGYTCAVRDGIPRFAETPADDLARRTQASFGYEWTHFDDWTASGTTNFQDYFVGLDLRGLRDAAVLDAGCGMGRHAKQLAPHCRRLVAVDFSVAIDAAARNLADQPNVTCLQADLTRLPLAGEAFDFVYSMGVVHHIADTEGVVRSLAARLRPGGRLRVYLYWRRTGWSGRVLRLVDLARRVTTRLPFRVLRRLCFFSASSCMRW
jgi:SAM-dependent methyltransferase